MEEQAQRKYGLYTPTSEGDDDFPSITGMIARYSALGFTNEEMSKNPVWVDKTGNGHDLQMKNFAWGGMSGVNGYVQNFNYFRNNATVDKVRIDEQSSNSIKVTLLTSGNEFKINVGEFISSNGVLYVASNGTYHAQIAFKNLGIYNDQIFSKDDCIKAYNYLQTLKAK